MADQDTLRAGIELADGFSVAGVAGLFLHMDVKDEEFPYHIHTSLDSPAKFFIDALAAQLRKQAQSDPHIAFNISVVDSAAYVEMLIYCPNGDEEAQPLRFVGHELEESIAFIKAIVDSKVLAGPNR